MNAPVSRTGATDREVETVVVTLTPEQVDETRTALFDYRLETDRYLSNYGEPTVGHDDCCETAQRRAALREEQRQSLLQRQADINGAIDALDAARAAAAPDSGPKVDVRAAMDQAWNEGYRACYRGEQQHSPYDERRAAALLAEQPGGGK